MFKTWKERYKENPEKYKAAQQRYRAKHRTKVLEYKRKHFQELKDDPEFREKETKRIAEWRIANRDREQRKSALKYIRRKYGVSLEEANKLLERRDDGCQVCKSKIRTAIDHCHKTGQLRGFLCQDCNMAVGRAKDDPNVLEALANYLRAYTVTTSREL